MGRLTPREVRKVSGFVPHRRVSIPAGFWLETRFGLLATVDPGVTDPNGRLFCRVTGNANQAASRHPSLYLAQDDRQNFNFLLRLHQLRKNCGNFIEYLVPALQLTAVFRALHGFISNVGEFRLAVSEILKEGHVVRTVDGLMFYS